MCFKQDGVISTLNINALKLIDHFIYLGSNILSTENDVNIRMGRARTANDRISIIWKSDFSDKIKRKVIQAVAVSVLLYGCTTKILTKHLEKS